MAADAAVERARRECSARRWEEALELLRVADDAGELPAEGLELLADCARWTGRVAEVFDPLERAHAAHVEGDDLEGAVRTALALSLSHGDAAQPALATAWWQRADSLIAGLPEGREHARHAWFEGQTHGWKGDDAAQERCSRRALDLARRHGDLDIEAFALVDLAHIATARGDGGSALAHLERAVSLALGGQIGILASGMVFCSSIWACRARGDWARATEWTDSATRWVERQRVDYFPGMCRVHRAEVLRFRGDLAAAERECEAATRQVAGSTPAYAIFPWAELGEIRRRRGDRPGARAAFQKTLELGWDPQPGLALLLLAEGDAAAALAAIERVFGEPRPIWLREDRTNLRLAQVEIALAAGEVARARAAAEDLAAIAGRTGAPWDIGCSATARGRLALAANDLPAAIDALRAARRAWGEIDAPYELARAGALLGRALALAGDRAVARLELEAAREVFARIGAAADRDETEADLDRLAAGGTPASPSAMTAARARRRARLRREGETWSIELDGEAVRLRHSRGIEYLARLLAAPGTELFAADLAGALAEGDAGELLDAEARAAYRRRAEELAEEIVELESRGASRHAEAVRSELETIAAQLAAAVGLGGRARRAGSPVERARQSVTKAIRSTIRRIAAEAPELGRYLEVTVRTGTACRFSPELREPVEWEVTGGGA